ncbi:MAG: glycosyltransferase family 61 protein [Hyphomicrobiales bacterium]
MNKADILAQSNQGFFWRFWPIQSRIITYVTKIPITRFAVEIVELAPGASRQVAPAISIPGEVDRALLAPLEDLNAAKALMKGGEFYDPPTMAYKLKNAIVADGCVYLPYSFSRIGPGKARAILKEPLNKHDSAQICSEQTTTTFFGDWLTSGTLIERLAEQRGIPPLTFPNKFWPHQEQYRQLLALPTPPSLPSVVQFKSLWLVDDRGMNPGRRSRVTELRLALAVPGGLTDRKVFLERGKLGDLREPNNKGPLREFLKKQGFETIYPEDLSIAELRGILGNAKLALGVEGSHLCHCSMLMKHGSAVVAIQEPNRVSGAIKRQCDVAGLLHGFVVGDLEETGFSVPLDRLRKTIDMVEAEIELRCKIER